MPTSVLLLLLLGLMIGPASFLSGAPPERPPYDPLSSAWIDTSLGGDNLWVGDSPLPGVWGRIGRLEASELDAAVVYEGHLVVAGAFGLIDGFPAAGIARWNGREWLPMGEPPGFRFGISSLAVQGGVLLAAGANLSSDAESKSCLYRWNGAGWEPHGPERTRSESTTLRLFSLGPRLIAFGTHYVEAGDTLLTTRFLLKCEAETWLELGLQNLELPQYGGILDLEWYRGSLYVSGDFGVTGSEQGHIARWDGSSWQPVGDGTDGIVHDLAVYGDRLVVAGTFSTAGGVQTGSLAIWDGATWAPAGNPRSEHSLQTGPIQLHDGDLIALQKDERGGFGFIRWDGNAWHDMGSIMTKTGSLGFSPRFLVSLGDQLVAGGFIHLGENWYRGLVAWEGATWRRFPSNPARLNDRALAFLPTEAGLVASGEFAVPDRLEITEGLGLWDGRDWRLIATDLDGQATCLIEYAGQVVAGGSFRRISGIAANFIASWNGTAWTPLGDGMNERVEALEIFEGRLIAGGWFTQAGGLEAWGLAAWNGSRWTSLGTMSAGSDPPIVYDLEVYGGELYAAGSFPGSTDLQAMLVAKWNGATWRGAGDPRTFARNSCWGPSVNQLVTWSGRLVAGGRFDSVLGEEANAIAVWDGLAWDPLTPPLLRDSVTRIAAHEGRLVAGGSQRAYGAGTTYESNILQWDGVRWYRMGRGVWSGDESVSIHPAVTALATWRGDLYVGGLFRAAGAEPSLGFAHWRGGLINTETPGLALTASPNPARGSVRIEFTLDSPSPVSLEAFDLQGRRVWRLDQRTVGGGPQAFTWGLRNDSNQPVARGVYFLRATTPRGAATQRVVVLGP